MCFDALFVCAEVVTFPSAAHPTLESDVKALFFLLWFFKPDVRAKNAFFTAAGRSRLGAAHPHASTGPGAARRLAALY